MRNKYVWILMITAFFWQGAKAQAYLDDVMLQSFGWDEFQQQRHSDEGSFYKFYNNHAQELKNAGFDMVWFPPPSASTGGVGYFPTELYNFTQTSWGSQADLEQMLNRYNNLGMFPIADIVANHRSGTTSWTDFTNPDWPCSVIVSNDDALTDPNYPGGNCFGPNADTGEEFPGSRDIDQTQELVRTDYIEFLQKLKDLGFQGWRWDVAKGFDPKYFGEYNYQSNPYLSVGEYLDGSVPAIRNWIDATIQTADPTVFNTRTSSAFDFPLYFILSRAIKNNSWFELQPGSVNQMPGISGQFGFASRSVTLVDNHDTFVYSDGFIGDEILQAYAYILTHPGIPSVFAPHYYGGSYSKDGVDRTFSSYKNQINEMIAIRKAAGIDANCHLTIQSSGSFYAATIKENASGPDVIAMKIGPGSWNPPGSGWILNTFGNDYAIWSKQTINKAPIVSISPTQTTFAAGSTVNVTISATDPENQATTIYYTTDGSEPTTASLVYSGGFNITENTFVKAIAVDASGKQSTIESKFYRIAGDISIYFKADTAPSDFTPPYIHYWNAQPSGAIADAVWTSPVVMIAAPEIGTGWYKYTFNDITSINVLFRTQNAHTGTSVVGQTQTGDLVGLSEDSYFEWDANDLVDYIRQANLSTVDVEKKITSLELSPNPTKDFLRIKSNNPIVKASAYNSVGNLVMQTKVEDNQVNVMRLSPGVYVLQTTDNKGNIQTAKFIKQ